VAWGNDRGQSQADRLASIKETAASERFNESGWLAGDLVFFSYRLVDENEEGRGESLNAYALSSGGHLQMAVYFDEPAETTEALALVEGVSQHARPDRGV